MFNLKCPLVKSNIYIFHLNKSIIVCNQLLFFCGSFISSLFEEVSGIFTESCVPSSIDCITAAALPTAHLSPTISFKHYHAIFDKQFYFHNKVLISVA